MKILFDSVMPYADAFFSSIGECKSFESGVLGDIDLAEADVLLTRSTTKVDKQLLLKAEHAKFIGTATAGINHFDVKEIEQHGAHWTSAAGCNARAVAEYVLASLLYLAINDEIELAGKSCAIVGVGEVGRQVASIVNALGMSIVLYDPPRAELESTFTSASFDEVISADFISLHAPLINDGKYPTRHMFNDIVLNKMNANQYLISASRGELIDTNALLARFRLKSKSAASGVSQCTAPQLVMDCWENEPTISTELMTHCRLATAHIAGHSLEGKARGTSILYDKLCEFLAVDNVLNLRDFLPIYEMPENLMAHIRAFDMDTLSLATLNNIVKCFYDIENDDSFFRQHMAKSDQITPIRKNYPIRREFDAVSVRLQNPVAKQQLSALGFKVL